MTRSLFRTAALLCVAIPLAGCNHWLARSETISYQAGDAVAWNRAVHTIDPWPVASADTTIPTSGRRIATVIERYESGPPVDGEPFADSPLNAAPAAAQ
jgi:hypothetical protein